MKQKIPIDRGENFKYEIRTIFHPLTIPYTPVSFSSWALSSVFFKGVRGRSLPGAGGASRADLKIQKENHLKK